MSRSTFFKRRRPRQPAPPVRTMLRLEPLEDRTLLSFFPAVNFAVGTSPDAVAVGDFNGDGKADMAVANKASNTVSVLLGNGNGTFQPAVNYNVGSQPVAIAVGDFNGDGKLDLVAANNASNNLSVLLGKGDGSFQAAPNVAIGSSPLSVAVGDLNADGKMDLVVTSNLDVVNCPPGGYYCTSTKVGRVSVLLGNGTGGFPTQNTYALSGNYPDSVALGDFNGDGKLDVVIANTYSPDPFAFFSVVNLLPGNGDGTLRSVTDPPGRGFGRRSVAVGDFNGDHKLDFAVGNNLGNNISVFLGNGNGTFQDPVDYATGTNPGAVAVADINGDGILDLVTANAGSNNLSVLLGYGNGTFLNPQNYAAGSLPFAVAVADFNGDHLPDLIAANFSSNNVSVLVNAADWSQTGAAANLVITGFPSPSTAGVAGTFTVTALDANGHKVTNYTGTVHFTSSDYQAVLPADYTFTSADAGVHTLTATLKSAGTQLITATDTRTSGITGHSPGIVVKAAAATHLIIYAPSSVTRGQAFSITVTAVDAYGNVATGYSGTIQFKSTDSTATLPANYTFTAADKGVHTFSGLILRKKGNQTITITDTLNSSLTGSVIESVL